MNQKNFPSLPLINTHTHAAMVAFRGLAEDLPLDQWLKEHIWPAEKNQVTANFVYEQTKLAIREMQKNGIQAFCDMYFFEEQVAQAAKELAMPVVIGETVLDFPTPSCPTPLDALARTEKLISQFANDPLVNVAVAPHSIYVLSEENLTKCRELANKYQTLIHIHAAETQWEFDQCKQKNDCSPIQYLDKLGLLTDRTLLAHCVWVTDEDVALIAQRKASVAHCPLSNLKLGSGIAPVAQMMAKEVNVSLGTDGAASSNRLDLWEAAKYAALLQKGINHDPTLIPAQSAIKMATIHGMKALGFKKIQNQTFSDINQQIEAIHDFSFLYA